MPNPKNTAAAGTTCWSHKPRRAEGPVRPGIAVPLLRAMETMDAHGLIRYAAGLSI
jgi:hypothetical protein